MNESTKTLTFLVAAGAAVLLAFFTRPSTADFDVQTQVGKPFEKPFDPEQAKRMKLVQFDEATATLRDFEVAEEEGVWSIPSKGGYPADAQRRMGQAVNGVMDKEILAVVSNSAADHDKFGVVDPNSSKIEVGQTGVGTRVTLSDGTGDALVDMIIGKEVKDTTNQHYVRKPTQDVVYAIDVNPDDFSTKFEDWIEPDLLKLNSFDVKQVALNDYTFTAVLVPTNQGLEPQLDWNRRDKMTLVYDEKEGKWQATDLQAFDEASDTYKPFTLAENQELNDDTLRELKNALDDLRIVDVDRKPEGLSASLKTGEEFMRDEQALRSLVGKGFMPVGVKPGEVELLSSEGEAIVTLKDGVEYVLRFGNLKLASEEQDPAAAEDIADAVAGEEKDPEAKEGVNRYLFVMARFNESAVERPELEELPPLPEDAGEAEKDEDASGEAAVNADDSVGSSEESANPEAEPAEEGEKPAETTEEAAEDDSAKKLEEAIANRKVIEQENQRKLDEYQETLKKGRERVKELNDRFGDWYYVISNDVFKKIHLGRDDVIKEKEQTEEGDTATDESASPSSPFGAPGTAIPGLPDISDSPGEEAEQKETKPAEATP